MDKRVEAQRAQPQFELRCGGLHVIIHRVPAWLVTLVTTAAGTGAAAWWTGR
ncbi:MULTISPECIES: hypothetical protein [unclassified Streptomyces]|uniref:hypothetical protein n=1 Tax=unclassified Streptomyces TaxID=2593676 RepID=UPI002E137767|nr:MULTISPECIES: hypothetical protein [unclassified Streptomyces]WSR26287.1 hypothetical protein OG573_09160 [Streptomyces sp. NBC_01205]